MRQEERSQGAFADPLHAVGRVSFRPFGQKICERLNRGVIKKVGDGCADAKLPEQAHYLYYQQRMAADLEEIVVPPDSFKLERFRPRSRYACLHVAHGRFIAASCIRAV